ncbi:hypothetical protein BGZ61DRAFT_306569, partial [Ilyonectria robusta]|uniref:uncharacterized protein n=1 Tax=Ilyonectria robusta TaxID=1079257 RepID=UPI001E8ED559
VTVSFLAAGRAAKCPLYASYRVLTGDRACVAGPYPQDFIQNGSFAVDHFSSVGAKVAKDFICSLIQPRRLTKVMLWEGSFEISTSLYWTPELPTTFENMHGYA